MMADLYKCLHPDKHTFILLVFIYTVKSLECNLIHRLASLDVYVCQLVVKYKYNTQYTYRNTDSTF